MLAWIHGGASSFQEGENMKTVVYLSLVLFGLLVFPGQVYSGENPFCSDKEYFLDLSDKDYSGFQDQNKMSSGYACYLAQTYFKELKYFDESYFLSLKKDYMAKYEIYTGKKSDSFERTLESLRQYHINFGPGPDFD